MVQSENRLNRCILPLAMAMNYQQAHVGYQIKESGKNISMLVANNKATFTKATGRIVFLPTVGINNKPSKNNCNWRRADRLDAIYRYRRKGDQVSVFDFEWTSEIVNKVKPIPINVFFKAIFPVILNKK
jgi:hypothetical protein